MRLFFGILFILIGVMVFTGSFQWDIFVNALDNLFQAWPFIFVLIGFSVLSKIKGLHWLKYFHALLAIAFFLFLFLWPSKNVTEAKIAHMPVDVLLTEEYQDYSIEIKGNAYGFFITEATETSAKRITGEIAGYQEGFRIEQFKNVLSIGLDESNPGNFFRPETNRINLVLPQGYTYRVIATGGVIEADLMLDEVSLSALDIKGVAITIKGNVNPSKTPLLVWLECFVLKAGFLIPGTATWSAKWDSGIKNLDIDNRLREEYTDPNINFRVNSGILNFELRGRFEEDR
ncbi:MAG TPA: hypothetical protein PKM99_01605 [Thermotogota bacterium]|nr:hypothetical protein [Thermotogota bacterium]NLZ14425.1 hypothetical protein [Thermotogaceae bacterium]MDD8040948.1 hypothetical protein [Thermotogota bacterium]MDD8052594.1 hypothetical protein [Thermotogota bacterium]HNR62790.1 hypothetical protein [Thermotogota bacterium]